MININIICIGKLKEKFWREACDEYAKRLCAFCRFKIMELPETKTPENPSEAQTQKTVDEEGKKILSALGKGDFAVAMCIEGKMISSEKLASFIAEKSVSGVSHMTFIIGGSWGLSDEVKKRADYKLSISPMTFPHQLARVMLCEQVYRAFQISSGGKYHK